MKLGKTGGRDARPPHRALLRPGVILRDFSPEDLGRVDQANPARPGDLPCGLTLQQRWRALLARLDEGVRAYVGSRIT